MKSLAFTIIVALLSLGCDDPSAGGGGKDNKTSTEPAGNGTKEPEDNNTKTDPTNNGTKQPEDNTTDPAPPKEVPNEAPKDGGN